MRWSEIAIVAAIVGVGCSTPATETVVVVDSDLRRVTNAPATLRVTVLRGVESDAGVGGDGGAHEWVVAMDAGTTHDGGVRTDAGIALPSSFAVVPAPGERHDDAVTVVLEALAGPIDVRRAVRFHFVPGERTTVRVFLTAVCAQHDRVCGTVDCTRVEFCERQGLTCGDDGSCTGILIDPNHPLALCGDHACGVGETNCNCPVDCMPRSGDDCCSVGESQCTDPACPIFVGDHCCSPGETVCTESACRVRVGDGCCSPGENVCSEPACPVRSGDGCCSPQENACNEPACPVRGGDGCCSPGENACNEGACPVRGGDGCCSPGENACNEGACPVRNGDGCCSPGESNCNEGACPPACGDGCCTGAESCHNCPGDCGTAACTCRVDCCNPSASGGAFIAYEGTACACRGQYTWCIGAGTVTERITYGGVHLYERVPNGSGSYCGSGSSSDPNMNRCMCPGEC